MLKILGTPPEGSHKKFGKFVYFSGLIKYTIALACLILLPLNQHFHDIKDDFTPAYRRNSSEGGTTENPTERTLTTSNTAAPRRTGENTSTPQTTTSRTTSNTAAPRRTGENTTTSQTTTSRTTSNTAAPRRTGENTTTSQTTTSRTTIPNTAAPRRIAQYITTPQTTTPCTTVSNTRRTAQQTTTPQTTTPCTVISITAAPNRTAQHITPQTATPCITISHSTTYNPPKPTSSMSPVTQKGMRSSIGKPEGAKFYELWGSSTPVFRAKRDLDDETETEVDSDSDDCGKKTRLRNLLILYPCCTTIIIILGMSTCGHLLLDPMTKWTSLFLVILCIMLSLVVFVVSLLAALETVQPIMIVICVLSAIFIVLEIIEFVFIYLS